MASSLERDDEKKDQPQRLLHLSGCPEWDEVIPECEVFYEGQDGKNPEDECKKNPGHKKFIPVTEFTAKNLPVRQRTVEMMDDILKRCILTLKVRVIHTSIDRPVTYTDSSKKYPYSFARGKTGVVRTGTGSIVEVFYYHPIQGKPCPCGLCKNSKEPKTTFWWIRARTATHVIHDPLEADGAKFICFYDSDDETKTKTIYGVDIFYDVTKKSDAKFQNDVCDVLCVTHDYETVAIFNKILPSDHFLCPPKISPETKSSSSNVIVSHPHGQRKRITIGDVLHLTVPIGQKYEKNVSIPFEKGTIYRKKSHAQKGECIKTGNQADESILNEGKEDAPSSANENSDDLQYDMTGKLEAIMKTNAEGCEDLLKTQAIQSDFIPADENKWKPKYVIEFYYLYMRDQILKILITCAVKDQRRRCGEASLENLVTEAYKEVFHMFLGVSYNPQQEGHRRETESVAPVTFLHHWENLLKASKDRYNQFKASGSVKTSMSKPSVIVSWIDEVEKTVRRVDARMEEENFSSLPELLQIITGQLLHAGLCILKDYEILAANCPVNTDHLPDGEEEKGILEHGKDTESPKEKDGQLLKGEEIAELPKGDGIATKAENDDEMVLPKGENGELSETENKNEIRQGEETDKFQTGEKDEKPSKQDGGDDRATGREDGGKLHKELQDGGPSKSDYDDESKKIEKEKVDVEGVDQSKQGEMTVSDGATFTLPANADYAYRVYSESPGWITFPPKTVMTLPCKTQVDIGDEFEFKIDFLHPERGFMTYETPTCPGSSGATVFCDVLGPYFVTYFPHSGSLKTAGKNRSGLRENFVTLYSRSFLFGSNKTSEATKSMTIQNIKAYMGQLLNIYKREITDGTGEKTGGPGEKTGGPGEKTGGPGEKTGGQDENPEVEVVMVMKEEKK